eukprot:XP_006582086.1 uncharacterized protein LOC102666670 isoform X1 [Glycine max]
MKKSMKRKKKQKEICSWLEGCWAVKRWNWMSVKEKIFSTQGVLFQGSGVSPWTTKKHCFLIKTPSYLVTFEELYEVQMDSIRGQIHSEKKGIMRTTSRAWTLKQSMDLMDQSQEHVLRKW